MCCWPSPSEAIIACWAQGARGIAEAGLKELRDLANLEVLSLGDSQKFKGQEVPIPGIIVLDAHGKLMGSSSLDSAKETVDKLNGLGK